MSEQSNERDEKPTRLPEFEERLGTALAAVFGNFAGSSALAARLHQSGSRGAAFQYVARRSADRQRAMVAHTEELRRHLEADGSKADRFKMERARLEASRPEASEKPPEAVVSLQIPGLTRDIGLGDAIAKLTAAVGISHCGGCARRAAALNRALTFRAPKGEK